MSIAPNFVGKHNMADVFIFCVENVHSVEFHLLVSLWENFAMQNKDIIDRIVI